MATRNERKRKAKAVRQSLEHSLATLEACKAIDAAVKARRIALLYAVEEWGRPIKGIGLTHSTPKAFVRRK